VTVVDHMITLQGRGGAQPLTAHARLVLRRMPTSAPGDETGTRLPLAALLAVTTEAHARRLGLARLHAQLGVAAWTPWIARAPVPTRPIPTLGGAVLAMVQQWETLMRTVAALQTAQVHEDSVRLSVRITAGRTPLVHVVDVHVRGPRRPPTVLRLTVRDGVLRCEDGRVGRVPARPDDPTLGVWLSDALRRLQPEPAPHV
jgi:hypothetical protein